MSFLAIDENGEIYLDNSEKPLTSREVIHELLSSLKMSSRHGLEASLTQNGEAVNYIVESFDHPLIGLKINKKKDQFWLTAQAGIEFQVNPQSFSLDLFDRICGLTLNNISFRLSDTAQDELFQKCDEFDDDSFTLDSEQIETPSYYITNSAVSDQDYWTTVYKNAGTPGWDLGDSSPIFNDMLQRLKLPKSRILVLGCGEGHDAAFFAKAGHVVTAIDFSAEAIRRAKMNYSDLENLTFIQNDVFNLPHEWNSTFDLIIEHTCFCAIEPHKRRELIKVWRRLLHEEGQILAIFFILLKRFGPPFGVTEWEVRELLKKSFHFLFWGRWREYPLSSTEDLRKNRLGQELFILAKKSKPV